MSKFIRSKVEACLTKTPSNNWHCRAITWTVKTNSEAQ